MPRLALVSPHADSSIEANLLRQHGFTIRIAGGAAAADFVLPASRGGSLAFVVADAATLGAHQSSVAERATQAAKAARRCSILSVGTPSDAEQLQHSCDPGIVCLHCDSHETACEFMLASYQRVAAASEPGGASATEELERAQHAAMERASAFLAQLWGVEQHAVDFLFAARPLAQLARVTSEEDWAHLVRETAGLVDDELLYTAVEWLQQDGVQMW